MNCLSVPTSTLKRLHFADSLVLGLHDGGEAHGLHPGGHRLLGVGREVVRPHVVVLSLETVLPENRPRIHFISFGYFRMNNFLQL